jgi:large subunit ribosomal protein L4
MDIQIHSSSRDSTVGTISVAEALFGAEYNEALVHQVVVAGLAAARRGTKANKSRGQVQASNIKPWRQKGTGRARAGSRASPIWRGGGVTFAAVPRNHAQKVNRRMYRGAMRAIVSELIRQQRLLVVEAFELAQPKTRLAALKLAELGAASALVITEVLEPGIARAVRNLPNAELCEVAAADPVRLMRFDKVVITAGALRKLEERLA